MTEPSLALQTAIRARLIGDQSVTDLVAGERIIDGPARPENFPTVIIGTGQTKLEGYVFRWRTVRVILDLHIWALESGLEATKNIGGAIWNSIGRKLDVPGYVLTDGITVSSLRTMRDPAGEHGHGILTVEAYMGCET